MTVSPSPRRKMSSAGRFWILMGATLLIGGVTGGVYAWLEHTGGLPGPVMSALILFVMFGLLIAGASLVLLPMMIGYGVAWFAWWVAKRV